MKRKDKKLTKKDMLKKMAWTIDLLQIKAMKDDQAYTLKQNGNVKLGIEWKQLYADKLAKI